MKTLKIISGGQTGADRTALECARALGIPTGGWVPRGFKTESGIDHSLKEFGVEETATNDYATRTWWNVRDSHITVWFGNINSPGYWCTWNAAKAHTKPFLINPTPLEFSIVLEHHSIVNVAGNRESTNPEVVRMVKEAFAHVEPKNPHA